jgi:DNA-binding response OmpR family regulator
MCSKASILIVDDDPNSRVTMALILEQAGYRVTTAASAQEGLRYLRLCAYALAFWDVVVPDEDGLSLLPEIRQLYPVMPILILTTHVVSESEKDALGRDNSDYLTKPVEPENILAHIRALCPLNAARRIHRVKSA